MANQEHVERLKRSVSEWNVWRQEHPETHPDLRRADLSHAKLIRADLSGTDLSEALLSHAILSFSILNHSNLSFANLSHAILYGANLSHAILYGANLSHAIFARTNLSQAYLSFANLTRTGLSGADLTKAHFLCTSFINVDLRNIRGLDTARHKGPSTIDSNSVILPHNEEIRLHFLQGVGFTETEIDSPPSQLPPRLIEYSSPVISNVHQDKASAKQLSAHPRANGYYQLSQGKIIIYQKEGLLELDGFLLQVGDQVELQLLGAFVPGTIAHGERGWYIATRSDMGIRLQTGLSARLLSLSSKSSPSPVRLKQIEGDLL